MGLNYDELLKIAKEKYFIGTEYISLHYLSTGEWAEVIKLLKQQSIEIY